MEKVTKKDADYRDYPNGEAKCSRCTMFRPPGACTKVVGIVIRLGWCKFFYAKSEEAKAAA